MQVSKVQNPPLTFFLEASKTQKLSGLSYRFGSSIKKGGGVLVRSRIVDVASGLPVAFGAETEWTEPGKELSKALSEHMKPI